MSNESRTDICNACWERVGGYRGCIALPDWTPLPVSVLSGKSEAESMQRKLSFSEIIEQWCLQLQRRSDCRMVGEFDQRQRGM